MTAPKHAKPYDAEIDRLHADAVNEFLDVTGRRPKWATGRHEKPADPFFPLDKDWQRRALIKAPNVYIHTRGELEGQAITVELPDARLSYKDAW